MPCSAAIDQISPDPCRDPAFRPHESFGDRSLLDHVTWQIGDGDRVGLCGPNGAGKTTLLKMLAGTRASPTPGAHRQAGEPHRSATCRRTG